MIGGTADAAPVSGLLNCASQNKDMRVDRSVSFVPQVAISLKCGVTYRNEHRTLAYQKMNTTLNASIQSGYCTDDEASDHDAEPCDSGRTRSSARRANQALKKENEANREPEPTPMETTATTTGKGRKRKKVGPGGDGSDSDPDENRDKSRLRLEPEAVEKKQEETVEMVCSCPKNVMRCIGILPSLPIMNYGMDSDHSDSSDNDDLTHTVLPTVARPHKGGAGSGGGDDGC